VGLSTAEVYAQADALGTARDALDPDQVRELAARPLYELAAVLENDLEGAAVSLRPELSGRMDALREAGALTARVTGSGPTVFGVFHAGEAPELEGMVRAEVA
jgi:4-diphosphocytidyl-2-C-methyl-D-erythritol kinase